MVNQLACYWILSRLCRSATHQCIPLHDSLICICPLKSHSGLVLVGAFTKVLNNFGISDKVTIMQTWNKELTSLSLKTKDLQRTSASPNPRRDRPKPLMHHVGTKPTFIQLQSWQMVCHSGPTGLDPVWFHASTSIPGSITHPGKRCGNFQRLASWAPRIRRCDRGNG